MIFSILIAISLNFDTFSVAIVEGAQSLKPSIKNSFKVGLAFTLGHVVMIFLGFFLGLSFKLIITNIDHWVAFILLSFVGFKLIKESATTQKYHLPTNALNIQSLVLLVIATSIDALAVGITLAFIKTSIISNAVIIAIITFCVSSTGYYAGKTLKKFCKSKVKIIGGLILITIGLKILIQHLFFSS